MKNIENNEEYEKLIKEYKKLYKSISSDQNFNIKINDYVTLSIELLNKLKEQKEFFSDEEIENRTLIYRIIYNIIKLEIACYNKSYIIEHMLKDENDKKILEELVIEDIEIIKKSIFMEDNDKNILEEELEKRISDENYSFLNINIIRKIINCYKDERFKSCIRKKLTQANEDIEKNNNLVIQELKNYEVLLKELPNKSKNKKRHIEVIKRKIISLALSLSLFLSISIGTNTIINKEISESTTVSNNENKINPEIYIIIIALIISLFPPCGPIYLLNKLIHLVEEARKENKSIESLYYKLNFTLVNCNDMIDENVELVEFSTVLIEELTKIAEIGCASTEEKNIIRKFDELRSINDTLSLRLSKTKSYY